MQTSLTSYLARLKIKIIKKLETYVIAGKMNVSYISEVVHKQQRDKRN